MLLSISTNIYIHAQDVIVMKDGSTIISKILEIGITDIKYKKYSNINGPIYTINKSEIKTINYENGERDIYEIQDISKKSYNNLAVTQGFIEKPADARNPQLISLYNRKYEPTSKIGYSKKEAKRILVFIGVKSTSLLSNEEVEIEIISKKMNSPYAFDYWCQALNIVNKTNRTIYIDKGNCFRVSSDTQLYCYYDNSEQTTVSLGKSSGVSIGLGSVAGALGIGGVAGQIASGISVGRESSSSVSTTYSQQRVIAIPAKSSRYLTNDKWVLVNNKSEKYELIESMERFNFKHVKSANIGIKKGDIHIGEILTFAENDLPWNRRYVITYSTDENFTTYSSLYAEMYIQEIIGVPSLMSPMNYRPSLGGLVEDELKFDTFIKNFNEYTIVGYHQF